MCGFATRRGETLKELSTSLRLASAQQQHRLLQQLYVHRAEVLELQEAIQGADETQLLPSEVYSRALEVSKQALRRLWQGRRGVVAITRQKFVASRRLYFAHLSLESYCALKALTSTLQEAFSGVRTAEATAPWLAAQGEEEAASLSALPSGSSCCWKGAAEEKNLERSSPLDESLGNAVETLRERLLGVLTHTHASCRASPALQLADPNLSPARHSPAAELRTKAAQRAAALAVRLSPRESLSGLKKALRRALRPKRDSDSDGLHCCAQGLPPSEASVPSQQQRLRVETCDKAATLEAAAVKLQLMQVALEAAVGACGETERLRAEENGLAPHELLQPSLASPVAADAVSGASSNEQREERDLTPSLPQNPHRQKNALLSRAALQRLVSCDPDDPPVDGESASASLGPEEKEREEKEDPLCEVNDALETAQFQVEALLRALTALAGEAHEALQKRLLRELAFLLSAFEAGAVRVVEEEDFEGRNSAATTASREGELLLQTAAERQWVTVISHLVNSLHSNNAQGERRLTRSAASG